MFRAALLLILFALPLLAEDPALVKSTDTWRYQMVGTNVAGVGTNWNTLAFDDSTWTPGVASFFTWGTTLGGYREVTLLPADGFSAALFRKQFQLNDPGFIRSLELRIDYEHGFVAYLNGSEVARRGFGGTNAVPLTASAVFHGRGIPDHIDLSGAISKLRAGTNVLAIQLHHAEDAGVDFALSAELLANFTRGPFVQNATSNSIQIIWRTLDETTGRVLFGTNTSALAQAFSSATGMLHVVTLTNLLPGQIYTYQVVSEREGRAAQSDWANFRTLKLPGAAIRFQVFGDTGQATLGQYNIAQQMLQRPADLVMHLGDVIYPYFHWAWEDQRHFSIYREQIKSVPFYVCMGNHDGVFGLTDYREAFYLPTNNVSDSEHWYSFDHGDAHFVVLATDTQVGNRYDTDSVQYQWLDRDLAATTRPWKFIFFHNVMRSSSLHSADDVLFDGVLDKYALQLFIGGLAEKYGAQVVFNGHDHGYERFVAFNGVNSLISGGGGAALYGQYSLEPGSMQFFNAHHFLNVTVDGPDMVVEAVDQFGKVFDRLYRSQVSSISHTSTWASLRIESTSDPSGNIPGQRFPFEGPSMRTRAGLQANLGRVHVRNDREFLYVGFEEAAIHDDQMIALFLENPDKPGITNMASLGDHRQGGEVDGLDLLPLEFKSFRPSIACLLGDELADGTFRSFQRRNMRWTAGQGVFNLDAMFSDVPGIRLQQFNRSPQEAPLFAENNADYIVLAIPLSALGNPFKYVRLGAVAFMETGTVALVDTAVLGASLEKTEDGRALLEPAIVQLALDPSLDGFGFRAEMAAPERVRFRWRSAANTSYWIQATDDIGESFHDLPGAPFPFTATGDTSAVELSVPAGAAARFFRLRTN